MTLIRTILSLVLLCAFTAHAAPVYTNLASSIAYAHVIQPEIPWSSHIIKYDYRRHDLRLISSLGRENIFGLRNLVTQIKFVPPALGRPLAGINGDFFLIKKDPYQGDPEGLQIMEGEFISSPKKRPSFWLDQHGLPQIGAVHSKLHVTWPNKYTVPFGLNEERTPDTAALLTPRLGSSTRTTNGVELVLERNGSGPWLPLHVNQTYSARVREVRAASDTPLSPDVMVLSLGTDLAKKIPATKPGAILQISTDLTPNLAGDATAIGGWPILVKKGKIQDDLDKKIRAPRTAVGWNDKEFFLFVIDGRQKPLSDGMTFAELAVKMAEIGCTEAMNLDGGGSTTMWVEGKVVNSPSDKHERSLGNALVLIAK